MIFLLALFYFFFSLQNSILNIKGCDGDVLCLQFTLEVSQQLENFVLGAIIQVLGGLKQNFIDY